uniref:Uncharacterized protein n=1 Tax=Mustela putorius furo TaxID=9669 RepID=M3YVX0_MUSPF
PPPSLPNRLHPHVLCDLHTPPLSPPISRKGKPSFEGGSRPESWPRHSLEPPCPTPLEKPGNFGGAGGGGGGHALAPRSRGSSLSSPRRPLRVLSTLGGSSGTAPSRNPGTLGVWGGGSPRGRALFESGAPTSTPYSSPPPREGGRACAPRAGSVRGHLVLGQQLAAAVDVAEDLLLELRHLLPQQTRCGRQLRVLALERLHFLLEARDALQLALAALRGSDAVAQPLALRLNALLRVHVDGRQRRALAEAWHVGHRLRLILERGQAGRPQRAWGRRWREGYRLGGKGDRRSTPRTAGAARVAAQVRVDGRLGRGCRRGQFARRRGARSRARGSPGGRSSGGRARAQLVLLVQVLQGLDEALGKLLLLAGRHLGVEELSARRRGGDQPVGLDDEALELGRGELEQPQ